MNLSETLFAAGMTPPKDFTTGRWLRFPGVGKGRSNRAGWCRVIAPTLAIYGDFSSGVREVWRDESHVDDETSARLLREAQRRERQFAAEQQRLHREGAARAKQLLDSAVQSRHPYLKAKGFSDATGLVFGEHLLIPVRDAWDNRLLSLQQISPDGEKRFLHGARARGGIFKMGIKGKTLLCEGYATALSLLAAGRRLYRACTVIVCFSAGNLETVAPRFPDGLVCADRDESQTGERAARKTGLRWVMPPQDKDFNDLMVREGVMSVVSVLRTA